MKWGMHVHSGTGIDQIWKREGAKKNEYLIVEAKGPNASLKDVTPNAPDKFEQMGIRWVMHNLIKMSKNNSDVANDILNELGLETGIRWPASSKNSRQGSTNYYGVIKASDHPQASLYGVVVQARWDKTGRLSYNSSKFRKYTDFTH
jgi:hypothetical protein